MTGYVNRVTPSLHSSSSSLPRRGYGPGSPALFGSASASRALLSVSNSTKASRGGRYGLIVELGDPQNSVSNGDSAFTSRIPWEPAEAIQNEQRETMSDAGTSKSSPRKLRHRPSLSPKTHSDETPTGRTLQTPRSPAISLYEAPADYADDEQGSTSGRTLRQGRHGLGTAASEDAITSPSRKQRLKRLIHKSSKLSLRGLAGRDELSPSASQELFAPPTLLTTPPRDISSPSSSSPSRFAISTRTSPRTPSPSPFFELSPQQIPRSVSYGDDASLSSNTSRGKAARILGEEIVPSGKAALVLGLEKKPLLLKRPSDASLLSPDSPTSGSNLFSITSAVPPRLELTDLPAPTLLAPRGHQRQRSLSGPSAFASLELPLTTPETSASSEKKFSFDVPGEGLNGIAKPSVNLAAPSGLVTPPPSPPVPLKVAGRTSSLGDSIDRVSNRSPEKVVSVASSTYEPSVFEGDEGRRPSLGRRLTLDSVRFSSIIERASTPSSASHRSSQNHSNHAKRDSNGTSSSKRSSGVIRPRPPLGGRSFSASVIQRSNMELPPLSSGTDAGGEPPPLAGLRLNGMRIRGLTALQEPMSEPELPSISEFGPPSARPRPKRINTGGSVASAQTRMYERSGALAVLEGSVTAANASLDTTGPPPPLRPPPNHALPPIPSELPGSPASPPPPQRPVPFLPRSESFLDFDLSSDDEYPGVSREMPESMPSVGTVSAKTADSAFSLLDRALSARLSSLPFRSDDDHSRWMDRVSREFPQEPQLSRSYSSPLLTSDARFPSVDDPVTTEVATREHRRKASIKSEAAESMLSLSSDEEDPDDADWTSAFPRPPGT